MNAIATNEYKRLRKSGWGAKQAVSRAKLLARWEGMKQAGMVRLRIAPDEFVNMDDLKGDTYSRKANPDIPEPRMAREEKEFEERIEREGVCGIVGEYWNGEEWVQVDSCWGFVGDNWKESGADDGIREAAMDAAESARTCTH